jgi:hypothetical protein
VRWAAAPRAAAAPDGLQVVAWDEDGVPLLRGTRRRIAVDLGDDARLDAALEGRAEWPHRAFGALGPAQVLPGLPQYWHPHLLHARARGEAAVGGEAVGLAAFDAYAEKNWGPRFPDHWWWGQAGFGDGAMAAFAGGRVAGPLEAAAIVARTGGEVLTFAPPRALVTARAGGGEWRLSGRSARHAVRLEGEAAGPPHVLPVPVPAERRAVLRSQHHLAGRLRAEVRRGRRLLLREESTLAGLELGTPHADGAG